MWGKKKLVDPDRRRMTVQVCAA